ncbi:uncharacterized protein LOC130630650 isoform X2 [Hydractinia symbiolongicarpus]|uniref:uncharacterized protein LOC130630650 isoform X2 n=1 Tax=Hydractinia symbiolongicarpus TaxID=13093 RepID=UPI00254A3FA1|nr:uncharacterized protein LOC130630650 isoform X2 [Hydractinia symbiolongicarpus]
MKNKKQITYTQKKMSSKGLFATLLLLYISIHVEARYENIFCFVMEDHHLHLNISFDDKMLYSKENTRMMITMKVKSWGGWTNYTTCTFHRIHQTNYTLNCRIGDIYTWSEEDYIVKRLVLHRGNNSLHLQDTVHENYYESTFNCHDDHEIKNLTAVSTENSTTIRWYTNKWDDKESYISWTDITVKERYKEATIYKELKQFKKCLYGCSYTEKRLHECTVYTLCVENIFIYHETTKSCVTTKTQCQPRQINKLTSNKISIAVAALAVFLFLCLVTGILIRRLYKRQREEDIYENNNEGKRLNISDSEIQCESHFCPPELPVHVDDSPYCYPVPTNIPKNI